MKDINFLGSYGYLTEDERKQPLSHSCEHFYFETCLDLSHPILVIPFGSRTQFTMNQYSRDVASFICWWTNCIQKDLNGFSGFHNMKFVPMNFQIIDL